MLAPNEVTGLIMGLITIGLIFFVFRRQDIPRFGLVYSAFFFVVLASFATLIEDVLWKTFFNTVEHLSHAVAGVLFTAACLRLRKKPV